MERVVFLLLTSSIVLAQKNGETLLYEENCNGDILVNNFPEIPPPHESAGHMILKQNPISRLSSCSNAGRFPIYGTCSEFLECVPDVSGSKQVKYKRRILQCRKGLWFSQESKTCEVPTTDECHFGRLVSNPPLAEAYSSCADVKNDVVRTLTGCTGFYTCRPATRGIDRYTYVCASGYLWSGTACMPANQVRCPPAKSAIGETCTRTCLAGDVRTCTFNFVVEEFASMSVFCKKCPFIASDCNLPGCVPGGGVKKNIVSINRQMPGPDIQVCKGDTLEINVQNLLPADGVTIHWHGLHQRATPYMDGVPHVTQCPIHSGNSFTYRMIADVSGTHMYHSHVGHQEPDGFYGTMIVREPRTSDPVTLRYDTDLPEHHMIVWHWFEKSAETQIVDNFFISKNREGYGLLVNGKGGTHEFLDQYGTSIYTPGASFNVFSNVKYRFRVIFNTAITCPIQISIDGHDLDILATDGRPIQAMGFVDSFMMSAGERIDFVPHPKSGVKTSGERFYIRIRGLYDCDENNKRGVFQTALLTYDGSTAKPQGIHSYSYAMRPGLVFGAVSDLPAAPDMTAMTPVPLMSAKDALMTPSLEIEGTPNKIFYIDVRFNRYTEQEDLSFSVPQLNNITWMCPEFPPLTQPESVTDKTLCKTDAPTNCVNGQCVCPQVLEITKGDLVEIVLFDPAGNDIGHPIHMHGYAFKVIAMGTLEGLIYPERIKELNERLELPKKFDGPLKDTVIVPGRGYTILRFIADNPGYWLVHCHISSHMTQGMALVMKVGEHSDMVPPPENFPKCGNFQQKNSQSTTTHTNFSMVLITMFLTYLLIR